MTWPYIALVSIASFVLGAFVMALCAISRCNDCELTNRIQRILGGK